MEIRPANMNNISKVYKKNNASSASGKPEDLQPTANQDVIEFSREGLRQSGFGKTARAISSEIYRDIPPERISSLTEAVKNGKYNVPSDQIAVAILSRIY